MKNRQIHFIFTVFFLTLFIHSCKTKSVNADVMITNKKRLEYYSPFIKSDKYDTNIFALIDADAVYKAAGNFTVGTIFFKDIKTDSLYILQGKTSKEIFDNISNINNSIPDKLVAANTERINMFTKMKEFLDNPEYAKIAFSSNEDNTNGKWDIYIIYSTAMDNKIKQQTLPITNLNNLNKLNILDLSMSTE